jgi:hypothetical protein
MEELLTFLDELSEKYNFSDSDMKKLDEILYAVDDEIYGSEYVDDEDEYVTEEDSSEEDISE